MKLSTTGYYTTTADNVPAGRAARYRDAAAATEGPAVRHAGMQTVARATTLEPAPPSSASSTTSLRASASTDPTSVSLRATPMHDTSEAPKRPSSPPGEDSEAIDSPPAASVDLLSFSVPALHLDPRFRRVLMQTAASRGVLELSPAQSARLWSIRPSRVARISEPAHAACQSGTDNENEGDDDDSDGEDASDSDSEDESDSDGEDEDGPSTPSQSAVSPDGNAARIPLNFTEIGTFGAAFARKRASELHGTGSQF